MKFTLSWLKEFLDTSADLQDIVLALNKIGLMVESVENPAKDLKDFKVVEIIETRSHPNADRLQICQINTGEEILQVVCGDPQARKGMKSVLARPGMMVPGLGAVLKKAKIRDVESDGMLCSLADLKLPEEREGIIQLDSSTPVGQFYVEVAGFNEPVIELELTSNRGDCLGVYGIARELMAAGIGQLKPFQAPLIQKKFDAPLQVTFSFPQEAKSACPVFMGRVVRGVKNGPSPKWLQDQLRSIGVRPISALVDITNFMTYHINRPMHAFDADKIKSNLTLRLAKPKEKFLALDEKEYTLDSSMTVIADDNGICALAGIMGGLNTGCTMETESVFLESAYFDPIRTAQTGRALGILSDSRYRFERGVDPALVAPGLEFATQMILDLCGGEASEMIVAGKTPNDKEVISFDPAFIKTLANVTVSPEKAVSILADLGFEPQFQDNKIDVVIPSWRHDIEGKADLVEEVVRIVGYESIEVENIPLPHPEEAFESFSGSQQRQQRQSIAKRVLSSRGLCECFTWSFLSRTQADLFGGVDESLVITNPLSQEMEVLRPSLLPQLIQGIRRNHNRGIQDTALFEVGPYYRSDLPSSQGVSIAGVRSDQRAPRQWLTQIREVDAFDVKADFFAVLEAYGIDLDKVQVLKDGLPTWYHPGRSGRVQLGPQSCLGFFGEIHPNILKKMDLSVVVVGFELLLAQIPLKKTNRKLPLTLSPFQPLTRDFSFILNQDVLVAEILKTVQHVDKDLITAVSIFDVYQGAGVPENKKSIGLTIQIEPQQQTLTEAEINNLMDRVIQAVATYHQGELRV
jgi:phenylalanyl-tRNA synthetase beta chain